MSIEQLDKPADIAQLLQDRCITSLMYMIWRSRKDLQQAFDLRISDGQEGFFHWYEVSVHREYGIKPQLSEDNGQPEKCNKISLITSKQESLYPRLMNLEGTLSRFAQRFLPTPIASTPSFSWSKDGFIGTR